MIVTLFRSPSQSKEVYCMEHQTHNSTLVIDRATFRRSGRDGHLVNKAFLRGSRQEHYCQCHRSTLTKKESYKLP